MLRVKDDGAVAVVVGVVVAFLVLPLMAVVIDTGGQYVERRQLQHSADSAAEAVAMDCKNLKPGCVANSPLAQTFATPNDTRNVDVVKTCIVIDVDSAGACNVGAPREYGNPYWCADYPTSTPFIEYVEVHVETAPGWATSITGNNDKLFACARSLVHPPVTTWYAPAPSVSPGQPAWVETIPGTPPTVIHHPGSGNPGVATVLAVTMSVCDWAVSTTNGTHYGPAYPTTIKFPTTRMACTPYVAQGAINNSANGGLTNAKQGNGIQTNVPIGNFTVSSDPGNSSSWNGIDAALAANPGKVWLIPLYNASGGTGSGAHYNIVGFAAFVLTSGGAKNGFVGYFTTFTCPTNTFCSGSGGSFGVTDPPWDETIPGTPVTTITHPPIPNATTTFAPTPSTSPGNARMVP